MLVVPFQCRSIWPKITPNGQSNVRTVQSIILAAILEFVANAPADFEPVILSYRDIACVEETMHISPHKNAIRCDVVAAFGVRTNMGSLQGRERAFTGHRASSAVEVSDQQPEGALAQSRPD